MSWRGGQVYVEKEYHNILFAADGEVYDLDGRKALVIGGAYSVDKQRRLTFGWRWWADEQPSDEIKRKTEEALEAHDWKMDIVLSHTGPLKYEPIEAFLPMVDQETVDKSTEIWLDRIEDRLDYQHRYFGHYHTEKEIDKISILFQSIQPLPYP
jgi:3-oxoacid CoA-transferase subunit A